MTKILDNWRATLTKGQLRHIDDMREFHKHTRHNPKTGHYEFRQGASIEARRYERNLGKVNFNNL